jgi:hypothetical protein
VHPRSLPRSTETKRLAELTHGTGYLDRQSDAQRETRGIVAAWIRDVVNALNLSGATLFTSMSFYDRFLGTTKVGLPLLHPCHVCSCGIAAAPHRH